MIIKKIIPFWKAIGWLAVIAALSLMPPDDLPKTKLALIPHFDKIVHAGLYLVLALLLVRPLQLIRLKPFLWVLFFIFVLGGGFELLQWLVTNSRSASFYDLVADLTGGILGWLLYRLFIAKTALEKYL